MLGVEKIMRPIHIWMFSGYAGSGKSCAASLLCSLLDPSKTFITAFADAVKDDVAHMYKLTRNMFDTQEGKASLVNTPDGEKTARELLIDYSLAMKEAYGEGVWAEEVVRRIQAEMCRKHIEHIVIHDWRYVAEIETLEREFSISSAEFIIHTIRIQRSCVRSMPIPSEHNIDSYPVQHCISNNGSLDDLKAALGALIP
jgi:hypothetical protein